MNRLLSAVFRDGQQIGSGFEKLLPFGVVLHQGSDSLLKLWIHENLKGKIGRGIGLECAQSALRLFQLLDKRVGLPTLGAGHKLGEFFGQVGGVAFVPTNVGNPLKQRQSALGLLLRRGALKFF